MRLFRRSPGALISSIKTGFIFEINVELGMVWESSYPGTRTDNIIRPGKETGHEMHIGIEEVVQSGILADQKGKLAGKSKLAVDVAFPRHFRGRGEVERLSGSQAPLFVHIDFFLW